MYSLSFVNQKLCNVIFEYEYISDFQKKFGLFYVKKSKLNYRVARNGISHQHDHRHLARPSSSSPARWSPSQRATPFSASSDDSDRSGSNWSFWIMTLDSLSFQNTKLICQFVLSYMMTLDFCFQKKKKHFINFVTHLHLFTNIYNLKISQISIVKVYLEPYLDLALCQAEGVCDLYASPAQTWLSLRWPWWLWRWKWSYRQWQ